MTTTLATVATQFLERPGLASKTVDSYEYALLPLLQKYGRWPIEIVDRECLEEHLNQMKHLAVTTHHRHQAILQALFNFAVEKHHIRSNPISGLKPRKPDAHRGEFASDQTIRYLTPSQLKRMYQALAQDCRTHTLVRLLHCTGARVSEVLELNLTDIELDNRKFQVLGKGNKQRWCFYGEDMASLLNRYCRYHRHQGVPALFTAQQPFSKVVSRLSYRMGYQDWKCLTQGIPELQGSRLHDLRHTFATERVGLMGIEELRALMGHESIQTTLRYQKVTSARAEHIAQKALQTLAQAHL